MALRFCDEDELGFGWLQEGDRLARTAHAVHAGGHVWLLDVVDGPGLDDRIRELGEPAAVVQLLDRHTRDCPAVAERLGIPLHVTPFSDLPGAPFVVVPISRKRIWREVALWFPDERLLVCGDALGSLGHYRARGEPFGVHPLLRLFPPRDALGKLEPERLLFGHGEGYRGPDAQRRLQEALATSRTRMHRALVRR